jgi:hypothetical protein
LGYKDTRNKIVKVEKMKVVGGGRGSGEMEIHVKEHGKGKRGDVFLRGMEAENTRWEGKIGWKKRVFWR